MISKNLEKVRFLTLNVMFFSIILALINPLQSSHGLANLTSGVTTIPSFNKNVTIIPGSSIKGGGTGAPNNLGNVSIMKLPTPSVSTNLANSIESPDPGAVANQTALAIAKAKSENSNSTLTKRQFSLNNLSNSSSNSSSNSAARPGTTRAASSAVDNFPNSTRLLSFSLQRANQPSTGFAGLNIQTAGLIHTPNGDFSVFPPDAQIAVGPTIVGEMVNVGAGFWTKGGDNIKTLPLSNFFKTGTDAITDPRIIYDNDTGRWFAYIQDMSDDTIRLAVSNSSDPTTAQFATFSFPFAGCPDQPSVGLSKDKMVISANVFLSHCPKVGNEFKGTQFTVVDKLDLLSNRNPPKTFQSKLLPAFYSVHVAKVTDSNKTSDLYLAKIGEAGITGGNIVSVFTISGNVPNIQVKNATLTIRPVEVPVGAAQPGIFTGPIDPGDSRVQDASWDQGKLFIAAEDKCAPYGDIKNAKRDCIRLIQVDTAKNNIVQDFDISKPNTYLYFPALAVDNSGNLDIFFGYSSRDTYPSIMAAGQFANGTKNALDYKVPIAQGSSDSPVDRYGDYFGVAVDPIKPKTYWGVGQVIPYPLADNTPYWNTFIANFTTTTQK